MKTSQMWIDDIERKLYERYKRKRQKQKTIRKVVFSTIGCVVIVFTIYIISSTNNTKPAPAGTQEKTNSYTDRVTHVEKTTHINSQTETSNNLTSVDTERNDNRNFNKTEISENKSEKNFPDNGTAVFNVLVLNGKIYKIIDDTVSFNELGEFTKLDTNSRIESYYSIKNNDTTDKIAYKSNGEVYCYNCIFKDNVIVSGNKYKLVDSDVENPDEQKGEYVGVIDGLIVYQSKQNPNAIVVDVRNILQWDSEILYVALKI